MVASRSSHGAVSRSSRRGQREADCRPVSVMTWERYSSSRLRRRFNPC